MADPKTKKIGTRAYLQWTPEMDMALLHTLLSITIMETLLKMVGSHIHTLLALSM
jgi:hypothetical protein